MAPGETAELPIPPKFSLGEWCVGFSDVIGIFLPKCEDDVTGVFETKIDCSASERGSQAFQEKNGIGKEFDLNDIQINICYIGMIYFCLTL